LDKAIEHYQKSLVIFEKLKDIRSMAKTFGHPGAAFKDKGELDKVLNITRNH
jgi:hypothetical protein